MTPDDGDRRSGDTGPRGPVDKIADLWVFGPLGLLLEARHRWPEFAQRGRDEIEQAFDRGRRAVGRAQDHATAAVDGLGLRSGSGDNGASADNVTPLVPPRPSVRPRASATEQDIPVVDVSTLAIPEYDSLSASQVVPRLAGLEPHELEEVRRYEAGNRGRKTILNKIAQLQSS